MANHQGNTVWAFDLGTGSIGEVLRNETTIESISSFKINSELGSTKDAAIRRRLKRTRDAHRKREAWLQEIFERAGIETLSPRKVEKTGDKRWKQTQDADYRLEREFAPTKHAVRSAKQKDKAPKDDTVYTSCLLRIKLLRKEGLEPWQIYKALRSALQSRGYQKVPWADKEPNAEEKSGQGTKNPKDSEPAGKWEDFKSTVTDSSYHFPCYYDAWCMGLWDPQKPKALETVHTHLARSTRNVVFPGEVVEAELLQLAENAADQLPDLNEATEEITKDFITERIETLNRRRRRRKKGDPELSEEDQKALPRATSFAELFVYGPAGKPAEQNPPVRALALSDTTKAKALGMRPGTDFDLQAAIGQKIPRFDNRVIASCAIFPQLHACKVAIHAGREIDPRSKLPAATLFLLAAKNLKVIQGGATRGLTSVELQELLKRADDKVDGLNNPTPQKLLDCYKLTVEEWKELCESKQLDHSPSLHPEGASKPIIPPSNPTGRCRFSRPALAILHYILLSANDKEGQNPNALLTKIAEQDPDVLSDIQELTGIQLFPNSLRASDKATGPNESSENETPKHYRLTSKAVKALQDRIWKQQTDDEGKPIPYAPHQIRIPDQILENRATSETEEASNYKSHIDALATAVENFVPGPDGLQNSDFTDLQNAADAYWNFRRGITSLIGQQNNPIVRDRLIRFWRRLCTHQNPARDLSPKIRQIEDTVRSEASKIRNRIKQEAGETSNTERESRNTREPSEDREALRSLTRILAALDDLSPGGGREAPDYLTIEFARDDNSLYSSRYKERMKKAQKDNERKRNKAKQTLTKAGIQDPTVDQIFRARLWMEQGGVDLYSGQPIGCTGLDKCEIDHIVPRALGGPDASFNRLLTSQGGNQTKYNRTPYQWFHDDRKDDWEAFKSRVKKCKTLSRRKKQLLTHPDAASLVRKTRDLNDTSWIARLAGKVVRLHFGWPHEDAVGAAQRVCVISGSRTASIRRRYALDALLDATHRATVWEILKAIEKIKKDLDQLRSRCLQNEEAINSKKKKDLKNNRTKLKDKTWELEKNRNDRRHHALDALILSFLPAWISDSSKETRFRFPISIGDRPAIRDETTRHEIEKLENEITEIRRQLKGSLDSEAKNELHLNRDKKSSEIEKLISRPNIPAVWHWFANQVLEPGELAELDVISESSAFGPSTPSEPTQPS